MEIFKVLNWIKYVGDDVQFDENKVGKWMYYFNDKDFISKVCIDVIESKIVAVAKHSNAEEGVACFYLNCDDIDTHKKIITFLIDNNMIRKTKTGRLYNMSFKLDTQTLSGEYGDDFYSDIKLSKFIDLDSGKWLT